MYHGFSSFTWLTENTIALRKKFLFLWKKFIGYGLGSLSGWRYHKNDLSTFGDECANKQEAMELPRMEASMNVAKYETMWSVLLIWAKSRNPEKHKGVLGAFKQRLYSTKPCYLLILFNWKTEWLVGLELEAKPYNVWQQAR